MRKLPRGLRLVVEHGKLADYLLSDTHPVGRHKAHFFRGLGFSIEQADLLREQLLWHGRNQGCTLVEETVFGTKYVVEGRLRPREDARIRTVWFRENGSSDLRLVTAYPVEKR